MSILDRFRLDGRVALVTGAGRGLGREMALALAAAGADVALLDRSGGGPTTAEIRALGRRALPIKTDLTRTPAGELADLVQQIADDLGAPDILVNNAGIIRRAPAADYTRSDWDDVLTVNLDAVFWLSQAAARFMIARQSGSIINLASMLTFQGGVLVPSYAASKHAVAGLTKALANEWAPAGVRVNAIAPGYMATDNTAPLRADERRAAAILDRIPAGRWGTPDDLAGAVVFLASDASAYVNGAILPVDGGWLAR